LEVEIRMQVKSRQTILGQVVHSVPKEVCCREEIQGRKRRQGIDRFYSTRCRKGRAGILKIGER
jgi:hypothetical protein